MKNARIPRLMRPVAALVCVILLGGCASTLRTYPAMSDAESLRVIAERLDSVTTISASADLTLTDAKGQTVSLDGAIVARPPDHARLRAWKFGSPVLDITILPAGVWAFAVSQDDTAPADLSRLPAAGISQAIELISGAYFRTAHAVEGASTPEQLVVVGPGPGGSDVRCEIDRATLTPRRFVVGGNGQHMVLTLTRYEQRGAVAWPRRMEFLAPDGEILVRFSEIELNSEPASSAFVPPRRAARLR